MQRHHINETLALLPISGNATIIKPHWHNPVLDGGCGIEFETNLSVHELVRQYKSRLIGMTHAAQFMRVYCAKGGVTLEENSMPLGPNRDPSDMIWHTDHMHREYGSAHMVIGESDTPTGIARKPEIARICDERAETGHISQVTRFVGTILKTEARGDTPLYFDTASESHLFPKLLEIRESCPELLPMLWQEIQAISAEADVEWTGNAPAKYKGCVQALITSRLIYHCKGYTAEHGSPRVGKKYRKELRPLPPLRGEIDMRFKHLQHNDVDSVELSWLKKLSSATIDDEE